MFQNERSVDIHFIPAVSKRPLFAPQKLSIRISVCTSTVSSSSNDSCLQPNMVPVRSILMENIMIPKVGSISDICNVVAKTLNDATVSNGSLFFDRKFEPKRLIVANVCNNRLVKIYSTDECYSSHFEDIVVYEEDDYTSATNVESGCQTRSISKFQGHHLPVFIRETNFCSNEFLISRPFIISVKHLTFEDIREAIFKELVSLVSPQLTDSFIQMMNEETIERKATKPSNIFNQSKTQSFKRHIASTMQEGGSDGEGSDNDIKEMSTLANDSTIGNDDDDEYQDVEDEEDIDEGVEASIPCFDCRSSRNEPPSPPFTISVVNLHANNEFSILRSGVRLDSSVDTYLAVNVNSEIVSKFFPRDINNLGHFKLLTLLSASSSSSNIKAALSLDECINQFTLTEKLGADDPWYCPRCKKHQMASKKFDIWYDCATLNFFLFY